MGAGTFSNDTEIITSEPTMLWCKFQLIILAIQPGIDPIAIFSFSAQKSIYFSPTVPLLVAISSIAISVARTAKPTRKLSQLVGSVSCCSNHSSLFKVRFCFALFLSSVASVLGFFTSPKPATATIALFLPSSEPASAWTAAFSTTSSASSFWFWSCFWLINNGERSNDYYDPDRNEKIAILPHLDQ